MSGVLATLTDFYHTQMERQRNRPFLRGVMAACAVIAAADGEVTFAERVRVDQIFETLEQLKVFDPHEAVELFNEFTDAVLESPADGHAAALAAIEPLMRDAEAGPLLLRICLAVSEADGEPSLTDQIEIVSLCSRFGVDPPDCGLYIDMPVEEFLAAHPPKKFERA